MKQYTFFATSPLGIEGLLVDELNQLGAGEVRESRAGVRFSGALECGYRACLWSRLASRIFLQLTVFPVASADDLYAGVTAVPWEEHLTPTNTLAVDASGSASGLDHTRFAALKVKDAIVDRLRERCGERPSVALERPDLRINLRLHRGEATVSLDLSGESLHRRGYRKEGVAAPLKENLAAAILVKSGWPAIAAAGGAFIDPMCGSGTLPIEAALMAADLAPGAGRDYFGFLGWRQHDPALWRRLQEEARQRREVGFKDFPIITGYDADGAAIRAARVNADLAGFGGRLRFECRPVLELRAPEGLATGLVAVNPPYGERLGEKENLYPLYRELGARLRESFVGWKGAVFTGNPDLAKELGLRARRQNILFNGALECKLLQFDIEAQWFAGAAHAALPERPPAPLSSGAEMFANRLRKNLKQLGRWAREHEVSCYRLYDADMPEYAVAVDLYGEWAHVQEYDPPKTVDPEQAAVRLREVLAALPQALGIPRERIALKVRKRQKGSAQYERFDRQERFLEVDEGGLRFLVNLTDYLDTGLFLDHRPTRQLLRELAAGKRFLNLFAYTGAATVAAAAGGAKSTVSVDLSRTYLGWARRNLELNGFRGPGHELIEADCLAWLKRERRRFDLIFLDPPTFSNSKSMQGTLDVQRDHVALIQGAAALLERDGVLLFSTNNRRFRLAAADLPELEIRDISGQTLPPDFARNPRIHQCWHIVRHSVQPRDR
ncbi:MAG TPA: bifunctional 23S rRNA (guanine(2069)-N(7))-methyltransferase RlmK/23S rRNA (guanine(2445)-N(2))-methyltransferase RlmL [Desulfuromonas sp.]|nr:bifunctional 23S rRNA (guanine(2069)-N(7))-methyltransferase RlmK/23S rRNA (guanine(2445)-N(2))-methyltransferase RlmL [Desulfuromonas sp.]